MEKVVNEVQTVKSTIKTFLELFRQIFDADACYLYLINNAMDDYERQTYLKERINDINNAYLISENKAQFPEELKRYDIQDSGEINDEILKSIDILKFIDIAKKDEVKGWELSFDNRPDKYVVFKELVKNEPILGEGLTAYMVRVKVPQLIFNSYDEVKKHQSSAFLNHKNKIAAPNCEMTIGFLLTDEKERAIGVLKIENYSSRSTKYTEEDEKVIAVKSYIPLLVQLIISAKKVFEKNSYAELFKGKDLLENLKKMRPSEQTNKIIYDATLHLFLVLKRNEFIGYDEILTRVTHYVMGIGSQLGLKREVIKSFEYNLDRFRKHEELLLSGLNNYRDHFMHQFHVFISGYIIINEFGIEVFKSNIENSMHWILSQNSKNFYKEDEEYKISEADVLRIWFLTAFYHDHAYILEKIDSELETFFENVLSYRFSIEFNWEKLLTKESDFSRSICDLLKYFSSKKGTNTDTLLQNYLNAIIKIHDHGVLGALLLLKSSEKIPNKNYKECLYAALAISLHNSEVYKDLKEGEGSNKAKSVGMSFESFPIAFLLAFCDTAQSFGRLETKNGVEASNYPVKFFGIDTVRAEKVTYKVVYTDPEKIPSEDQIKGWAQESNEYFTSLKYSFVIEYYKPNEKYVKKYVEKIKEGLKPTEEDLKLTEKDLICSLSF